MRRTVLTAFAVLLVASGGVVASPAVAASTEIPVGKRPRAVVVSPDSSTVYAANYDDDTVSVIDAGGRTVTGSIPVGDGPAAIAISPDGRTLYTADTLGGVVTVIDTVTRATQSIAVPSAVSVVVSPDGSSVYVAGRTTNSVSVIDASTRTVAVGIALGKRPRDLAFSPDGATVYVTTEDRAISVIDAVGRRVARTIPVEGNLTEIAVSPDGSTLYVGRYDALDVIDAATGSVKNTTGFDIDAPADLAVSRDGGTLYVLLDRSYSVYAVDPPTGKRMTTYSAGRQADGLALSPDGASLYTAASRDNTVVVNDLPTAPIVSVSTPPPPAEVGQPYSYTFTASGNPAPTFSVSAGVLPNGLSLGADGVLSGTPTQPGSTTFTVTASNGIGQGTSTQVTFRVDAAPAFTAAAPPTAAIVGTPYAYTFTASGSPLPTFAVSSGALPAGLSLTSAGVLSGTPTEAGTATFTVTATNGVGPDATSDEITLEIDAAPVFTAATPPTTATVGTAYSYTFVASGAPAPAYAVSSGALPAGLSLTPDGVLSGTPTEAGPTIFTITASNGIDPDAVTQPIIITTAAAAIPAPAPSPSLTPAPTPTNVAATGMPLAATGAESVGGAVLAGLVLLAAGVLVRSRRARRAS